jgi:glucose-6-phosphate isomerase
MSVAPLRSLDMRALLARFDPTRGSLEGASRTERRLSDLKNVFRDGSAYEAACASGNPLVYTVETVEAGTGDGDLHFGLGVIYPGRVGREYFMTKGHLHSWREAAELYIGLSGSGVMLLEDEATGESRMLSLGTGSAIYVPGHTGHRTINVGNVPLSYIGVFPARAGHDYGVYASRNFRCTVVDDKGVPKMVERDAWP